MVMTKTRTEPLISVCIPVYETEPFLAKCLCSVFAQDFSSFEIIVVNDDSKGKDSDGRNSKKIVRQIEKEGNKNRKANGLSPVKLIFEEHHQNRGILEVRRTLAFNASGEYIVFLDSDDELEPNALSILWNCVSQNGEQPFDIVHSTFVSGYYDETEKFIPLEHTKCGSIYYDKLTGHDIFSRWINGDISGNVCGKIIRRNLINLAFDNISYTECNMADDLLLFFFISQYAKSYKGIEAKVYRYRVNSGMSSGRKIDSLHRWKMICTTASVFTILSQWCKEHEADINSDEVNHLRLMTRYYLENNIKQMRETVIPELQPAAREMLCDYWGESFVEKMEKMENRLN